MARWDETRGVWRITATVSRPGQARRRVVQSVKAPRGRAGKREAEAAEIRLKAEVLEEMEFELPGGLVPGSFANAAAAWVDRHPNWSPKTVKETRYALRRSILPTLGSTRLDLVTPAQIEDLYAAWARAGYSPSVMRRWHGMVRSIFADALRLGLIRSNPMTRVNPAGGTAPERMHIPEPAEVRATIAAAESPAAALFFELAAGTGARRGTLVALRWRDFDLDRGTVVFSHAVTVGEDGPVVKGTKANRPYAVHLPERALEALQAQQRAAKETALALGLAGDFAALYVFSRDGGTTHWSVGYPTHAWQMARRKAGVTDCRLHDLRHFAATRMLTAGIPTRAVADRLGCTEANVIKTYSHRVPSGEDVRAAEVLNAALNG